jgi:phosphatidylinositol N-acetylglucosaminyltransferase subunit Q
MEVSGTSLRLFFAITGTCGFLGATLIFALLSDLLSFSASHISLLYSVSSRIYFWQFNILASTFNLFRGRRYNPLRVRVDAAQYDLDQTLIGTIVFTLLLFLLPTIAAYYILFSMVFDAYIVPPGRPDCLGSI